MKHFTRLLTLLLCLSLLAGCGSAETGIHGKIQSAADGCRTLVGTGKSLLSDPSQFPAGSSACDWTAMAFVLSGVEDDFDAYLSALAQYVTARYAANGTLDAVKATEYHRIALTVGALGGDPTAFGTDAEGKPVDLIAAGTYDFPGDLGTQGINGPVFALLTLDSGAYTVPDGAKHSRQELLDAITGAQEADGGFGLMPGASDADMTAMALQALAPYREDAEIESVIERALSYLAAQMTDRCTFPAYGSESVETACQVVVALCALGIDPAEDERFLRGETGILDSIENYRRTDGSYAHTADEKTGNLLATGQVMLALSAVQRLREDGRRLYDFSNQER